MKRAVICKFIWIRHPFLSVAFNNLHNRELEESHEEWSSHKIIFRNSVIRNLGRSLEASRQKIYQDRRKLFCTWLINWLFWHSAERNSVQLTRFILFTRKAVLHCSWCSSLSLSIYNCLVFFSKSLLLKSSLCSCSMVIDNRLTYWMRRMYVPRKTSHKTYASLVSY